jgi:hypothetical protein
MTEPTDREVTDTFPMPAHGFTCFHCGETFTTPGNARNHFGFEPSADPACRIKIGAERGLVMALRKAEADLAEAWSAIHNESTEAAKAYYAQSTRHRAQLMAVEEAGYEKGLADGRAQIERDTIAHLAAQSGVSDAGQLWKELCDTSTTVYYEAGDQPNDPEGVKQAAIADAACAAIIAEALAAAVAGERARRTAELLELRDEILAAAERGEIDHD